MAGRRYPIPGVPQVRIGRDMTKTRFWTRHLRGYVLIYHEHSSIFAGRGPHLSFATKDGGPVLKWDANWRTFNGIMWNGKTWCGWFVFRRRSLWFGTNG